MSKQTKFTPGPWICDGADILAPETRFRGKDEPLASMNIESNKWPFDARLITAAPELLKVCSNTLVRLKDFYSLKETLKLASDQIGILDQIQQSLEYVVSKAEGRDE